MKTTLMTAVPFALTLALLVATLACEVGDTREEPQEEAKAKVADAPTKKTAPAAPTSTGDGEQTAPANGDARTKPGPRQRSDLKPQMVNTSAATDRQILTNLFYATDGENWDYTATWASERPLGDWHGVVTNDEGRVVELQLGISFDHEYPPNGEILGEIHNLDKLQSLSLSLGELEEMIPRELGHLSELRYLGISGLHGEIPSELGHLSHLEDLYIHGNTLEGTVPQEIFELAKLQYLTIEGESLHAEVSDAVETLILRGAMVTLEVEALTGCLSEYAYHQMSGQFYIYASGPELPACDGIYEEDLNVLRELFNEWRDHGSMSDWLTRLPVREWEGITTDRNGRVVGLDFYLGADDDGLEPSYTMPEAISRLTALKDLAVISSGIKGEIPGWIANLTQLRELNLSNNELSGKVPTFLSSMPQIWWITLGGNNLTGCLPKPPERPLPPDLRGPVTEGADGKPVTPMGVPELMGVEYCP